MNRIHRPRIPLGLIGLALALTAIGILTQLCVFYEISDPPSWTYVWLHSGRRTLVYNLLGLALMLGIMYLDYGFIGRHAYLWYVLYMAVLLWAMISVPFYNMRGVLYHMYSIYPILLAALLYRNRQRGLWGAGAVYGAVAGISGLGRLLQTVLRLRGDGAGLRPAAGSGGGQKHLWGK